MLYANKGAEAPLDGQGLRIGIVQARFNADITDALASACLAELEAMGVSSTDIDHVRVPGARLPRAFVDGLISGLVGDFFCGLVAGIFGFGHYSSSSKLAISTATRAASRPLSVWRATACSMFSTVRIALAMGRR